MKRITLAIVLYSSSSYAEVWGWKGPIEERSPKRLPGFSNTYRGKVSFVKWMVPLVRRHGLSEKAALLYTAHVARETTYGYNVYNFNFGNTKTGSMLHGPWMWLFDSRGDWAKYRAFDTADDGLENNIRLLRDGAGGLYKSAWQMLLNEKPEWYGEIGIKGYYAGPRDPQNPKRYLRHTAQSIVPVQREYNGTVGYVESCWRKPVDGQLASVAIPTSSLPWWWFVIPGVLISALAGFRFSVPDLRNSVQKRLQ